MREKKILIIEDEQFIRELYRDEIKREGYNTYTAENGKEGLLKVYELKPDLILLDIMLPKLSGLSLLKEIKNNKGVKDIPVILLTNLGQDSVIKEAFSLGAEGYLLKASYTPAQIIEEINKFFKNHAS